MVVDRSEVDRASRPSVPCTDDAGLPCLLRRRPDLIVTEVGGRLLVYDAEGRAIHVLNASAKAIWDMCDGEHSVSQMVDGLRTVFAVPAERDLASDVRDTLGVFRHKGLLLRGGVCDGQSGPGTAAQA